MLKYLKNTFSYEYADWIQSTAVVLFVLFFVGLCVYLWFRPSEDYQEIKNEILDSPSEKENI